MCRGHWLGWCGGLSQGTPAEEEPFAFLCCEHTDPLVCHLRLVILEETLRGLETEAGQGEILSSLLLFFTVPPGSYSTFFPVFQWWLGCGGGGVVRDVDFVPHPAPFQEKPLQAVPLCRRPWHRARVRRANQGPVPFGEPRGLYSCVWDEER